MRDIVSKGMGFGYYLMRDIVNKEAGWELVPEGYIQQRGRVKVNTSGIHSAKRWDGS